MNPTEFQALALAWLGAITVVATAGIAAFFSIKAKIDDNRTRIDKHDEIQGVDTKTPDPAVTILPPQPQSTQPPK